MGTYTTNYNLFMPSIGEQGWGDLVNGNFSTIDTTMKSLSNRITTCESYGTRITAIENEVNGNLSCTSVTASRINGGWHYLTPTLIDGTSGKDGSFTLGVGSSTTSAYTQTSTTTVTGSTTVSLSSSHNVTQGYLGNGVYRNSATLAPTSSTRKNSLTVKLYHKISTNGGNFTTTLTINGESISCSKFTGESGKIPSTYTAYTILTNRAITFKTPSLNIAWSVYSEKGNPYYPISFYLEFIVNGLSFTYNLT